MKDNTRSYVIKDGILYTTANVLIEGSPPHTYYANLSVPYKVDDVISKFRDTHNRRFFFPSYDGGNVIYMEETREKTLVCVEFEPSRRLTRFDRTIYKKEKAVLAFPYVYLFITASSYSVDLGAFYRNTPVVTLDDELYCTNLWNISSNGQKCADTGLSEQQITLENQIGLAVHAFWNNEYTDDHGLWEQAVSFIPRHPRSVAAWESQSNRWFGNWRKYITSLDWKPSRRTMKTAISERIGGLRPEVISDFDTAVIRLKREGKEYYPSENWME